jgi:outer membrane lipoprotein-sorting protein
MAPPRQAVSEEARRAIDLLVTRWHAVTDLRALADIAIDRGGERQQLTGVVLAKAPGSVRFEALSPFGQPIAVAVVHHGRLTAFSALTNQAVVGDATAETTAHLLKLPLEPQDLVAVVSGHAVPPADLRMAEIMAPDGLGPSLSLVGAVSEQRVWMDFQTGVVRQLQIIGGRAAATVTYLRDDAGQLTGFDLTAAERYVSGSVRYRNVATAVGLSDDRFALALPKDAKTQPIR